MDLLFPTKCNIGQLMCEKVGEGVFLPTVLVGDLVPVVLLIGDLVVSLVLKHVLLVGEVGEPEVPGCRQEGGGPGGSPHPGKVTVISQDFKTKIIFIIIIMPHDYFHQNYDQTLDSQNIFTVKKCEKNIKYILLLSLGTFCRSAKV